MIQDQSIQNQPVYEQVQVINTTDQSVCVTGLDKYLNNMISTIPIVIQQPQSYQIQQQQQQQQPNQRIILITKSPQTSVVENIQNQSTRSRSIPRTRTRTSIIQLPFLPKRPSATPVVKKSSPIKNGSVKTIRPPETYPNTNLNKSIEEEYMQICNPCSSHSAQSQISKYEMISKDPMVSYSANARPTLASMAGLQLTGSAVSIPTDMSGAMPTATVEEINVPVFINEYLQQSATLPPIPNGDDHSNISNKSTESHWSENDDFCIEGDSINLENCAIDSDVFDKFEFDLESIETDDNTNSSTNIITIQQDQQQQHQFQQEQHHQQQQQIEMMFNNNNYYNIDVDVDIVEASKNFEEDISKIQFQSINYDNRGEEINKIDIKEENETFSVFGENQLLSLPFDENEDDECSRLSMLAQTENAIDISPWAKDNELPLSQILISSQNDPMISCTANNNSQTVLNAEPIVPDIYSDFIYDDIKMDGPVKFEHEYDYMQSASGAIKRLNTSNNNDDNNNSSNIINNSSVSKTVMSEKRRKLHLETSLCVNVNNEDLNTPDVIELIDKLGTDKSFGMHYKNPSDIVNEFMNISNSSFQSAKAAETHTPSTIISFEDIDEQPSTPQSCTSSSYTTSHTHTITSPNSPAPSFISTTTRVKSRRGRPPKEHSDRPDPSKLRYLSESERKRAEDRAKNNEASRISRLKTKKREEEEIEEEMQLIEQNNSLNNRYHRLCMKEEKLKFLLGNMLSSSLSA